MKTLSFHDWACGRGSRELVHLGQGGKPFEVRSGLHLIVAPNGYGKSTFLQTVAGGLKPLRGEVQLEGHKLVPSRDVLYLSEYLAFPKFIRPDEWIGFMAARSPMPGELDSWYQGFDLEKLRGRPLGKLSQGERRKVTWLSAQASHKPVLLLDEPLDGLDILAIRTARELLTRWSRDEGRIIFLVAHQVAEVLDLAQQVWLYRDHAWVDAPSALGKPLPRDTGEFRSSILSYYA